MRDLTGDLIEFGFGCVEYPIALPEACVDDREHVCDVVDRAMQPRKLIIHAPLGSRLNRAWGLALRKRFCRSFNFELQAAATEDAIVISLGETHSFPLEDVARFLHSNTAREVLTQAVLDAPMFTVRWRWNSNVSLAIPRFRGGKKVPPQLQRMQAEDLIAVVFPEQRACLENIRGDREIPEHPLVSQTLGDCLTDAMDADGLETLLRDLESGARRVHTRDLTEPSPLAQEILNARPYAFLDDAPLEERRTQAVQSRRWLDPQTAADLGSLDPGAIERVRAEAWPPVETADELHDALMLVGYIHPDDRFGTNGGTPARCQGFMDRLTADGRATILTPAVQATPLWIATERLPQFKAGFTAASISPQVQVPEEYAAQAWGNEEALREIVRSRLQVTGPITAAALATSCNLEPAVVDAALVALEAEGFAMRGNFTPASQAIEWCERRLLARIHRYTVQRLRQEIEPVSAKDFLRFLLDWQHVAAGTRVEGPQALAAVLEQLEGFEAAAAAWEPEILPCRMEDYEPGWLDNLCLSGRYAWARRTRANNGEAHDNAPGPVRTTPIAFLRRSHMAAWLVNDGAPGAASRLSPAAQKVLNNLRQAGASFFEDLLQSTGLLGSQVEGALAELVGAGLITADSFSGLRALLVPSQKRRPLAGGRHRRQAVMFGIEDAGRWTLLRRHGHGATTAARSTGDEYSSDDNGDAEYVARKLLQRYGVVFKRLLARETRLPPWRDLLYVYHRLEARGEIRGGRFVAGFAGEQFALPEAVGALRKVRNRAADGALISLSAADPLNLVGIITPGARLPALSGNRVLYKDGLPIAVQLGKDVQFLQAIDAGAEWDTRNALLRRGIPPALRSYLGNPH